MFYGTLLLTAVNLLLRLTGTAFQVYISGRIGAAGVGLLQLVLSVTVLAHTVGAAGVRTASMYLSAGELGRRREGLLPRILSGCTLYSLVCSGAAAAALFALAQFFAGHVLGEPRTAAALRAFALFLPAECLCGVLQGYFTAARRIGTLALVGIAEQLCTMAVTAGLLGAWASGDAARACTAVILGSGTGACLSLFALGLLLPRAPREKQRGERVWGRLLRIAVPLALADDLRAGLRSAEKLIIPARLALHAGTDAPLAAFGAVCGMVMPVLMFPAAVLFALSEMLIPELARCTAAGSARRVRYLVRRSLRMALLYGLFCGGLLYLLAAPLGQALYQNAEAGRWLRLFALTAPVLYCDCLVDAMTRGLGQQNYCVYYNIVTSVLDIALLFVLLPRFGMTGYFFSFAATHLVNFALSLRRLLLAAQVRVSPSRCALALTAALFSVWAAAQYQTAPVQAAVFVCLCLGLQRAFGVLRREDARWARTLIFSGRQ